MYSRGLNTTMFANQFELALFLAIKKELQAARHLQPMIELRLTLKMKGAGRLIAYPPIYKTVKHTGMVRLLIGRYQFIAIHELLLMISKMS